MMRSLLLIIAAVVGLCLMQGCQSTDSPDGQSTLKKTEPQVPEREQMRSKFDDEERSPRGDQNGLDNEEQHSESTETPAVDESATPASETSKPVESVDGKLGDGLPATIVPFEEEPTRNRRRMDIDQLNTTIVRVTGGIAWFENNKNQFEVLASTLGKPDYLDLTREDFEPSALFQKFLDDAARAVCSELIQKELTVPSSKRVLMLHSSPYNTWKDDSEAIDKNLVYLLLRYHGRELTTNAAELQQWRWLYKSAEHVSKSPVTAWRTVCIGLMTHPYFYTY